MSIKKFLDLIFRLVVNEAKVLFDVTRPLELIATLWALVLASLRRLLDVASQGRELGEGLSAGAKVGLVLGLGRMLCKLMVVSK